jgi:hypothetical protein
VEARGRSCPAAYRYRPEALAQPARLEADALYVVGGLYGNRVALRAVLERADREPGGPAAVVFNGDFHWLDTDPDDFHAVSHAVLAHHATKGNVEAELASDEDAGCGCAYPDYVGDDVVDRSNRIITRLRTTASRFPDLVRRHRRRRPALRRGGAAVRPGRMAATLPGPVVARQPRLPLVLHPPHPRHPPAAGTGRASRRAADRRWRAVSSASVSRGRPGAGQPAPLASQDAAGLGCVP